MSSRTRRKVRAPSINIYLELNALLILFRLLKDCPHVDDIEALILVQEVQFEKCRQELSTPYVTPNIAQTSNYQNPNSHNYNATSNQFNHGRSIDDDKGRGYLGGRGRSRGRGGTRPTCQLCNKYCHDIFHC